MQDENQNGENKKSSAKMSDIIQEIESVVKEEKQRSSPLEAHDKNVIETQNSEGKNAVITFIIIVNCKYNREVGNIFR